MCLAIYKPAGASIEVDALRNGFSSNPHGAGFAVANDGILSIHKGFFTFDDFLEAYSALSHLQMAIHFRWATHGNRDKDNCHPFQITPDLAVIHNGVLDIECDIDKSMSDTWHYVEYILKPLAERDAAFFDDPVFRFLGESHISGSKMVFLRADGEWGIWNSQSGYWQGDCWFSNKSHEASRPLGFTSAASRALAWYRRDDEDELIVRDEGVRVTIDEVADRFAEDDLYDFDLSDHYHDMTEREQLIYERLCVEGWEVDMLDDLVRTHGVNALYEMAAKLSTEKEGF